MLLIFAVSMRHIPLPLLNGLILDLDLSLIF